MQRLPEIMQQIVWFPKIMLLRTVATSRADRIKLEQSRTIRDCMSMIIDGTFSLLITTWE